MAESPYEATFEGLHSWGSQAHGYGMFPAYFLSSFVLGVRRDHGVILVEPRLADLEHASGTVVTELGPVSVNWVRGKLGGSFKIIIPEGARAILHLPIGTASGSANVANKPRAAFKRRGRWLETKLSAGIYSGTWTLQETH